MEFHLVVAKHGEEVTKQALIRLVSSIGEILSIRTNAAINGVLVLTQEELERDARKVARVLDDYPFNLDEKFAVIAKAWEIIGP